MASSEERLEQLEQALQQAGTALQAATYRIAALASMGWCAGHSCDNNSICLDGRDARARETLQLRRRRSVVEELELRHDVIFGGSLATLKRSDGKGRNMRNVSLTSSEQVSSRQSYCMLSLSTSGEAQRRLQNVPEGEGAEAWKAFSEIYEPKTAARYVGMHRQILLYDFGELSQLIDRIEQFRPVSRTPRSETTSLSMRADSTCSTRWPLRYRPLP